MRSTARSVLILGVAAAYACGYGMTLQRNMHQTQTEGEGAFVLTYQKAFDREKIQEEIEER